MKKFTSLALIMTTIATSITPAMAWTPSNTDNPKCIDIRMLGVTKEMINLPESGKSKSVCGCKTCKVDAVTYGQLIPYIDQLAQRARSIQCPTNPECKQNHDCHIQQMQSKNEINNIKVSLESLRIEIELQNYKDNNYYFVSMNNVFGGKDLFTSFQRKEGIKDDPKFDDIFWANVSQHIDNVLTKMDSAESRTHETFKPNTENLEKSKTTRNYAIGATAVAEIFEVATWTDVANVKDVREALQNKLKSLPTVEKRH